MFLDFNKISTGPDCGKITARFNVTASHPHFDGHFDGFPVWPAVSQLDLVVRALEQAVGSKINLQSIGRSKFTAMIQPETDLHLDLEWANGAANWELKNQEKVFSRGLFKFRSCKHEP